MKKPPFMKKSLLALAALGVFSSAAMAESSVTIGGRIDTGVNFINNVQAPDANQANLRTREHQFFLSGDGLQSDALFFKGVNDFDNGLKAIFTLETGFDVNNGRLGQGGDIFGRQAFVGLQGEFGSVTIGRQYDSVVDFIGPLAASNRGGGSFAVHPGDLDNFDNSARVNNAIKYTSPDYDGFTFGALYSVGGIAGHDSQNQIFSIGAGYANGPLALGAAFLNARNPNLSFYGNDQDSIQGNNLGNATAIGVQTNPVYAGFASAHTLQIVGVGGTYAIGPFTAGLTYSNTRFKDLGDAASGDLASTNPNNLSGSASFNNAEASLAYQFSPVLSGIVAYDFTDGSNVGDQSKAKYHQVSAGLDYWLSKRTDVYILGAFQKANGKDSTGQDTVAMIGALSPSNSSEQAAVRVGLRHKF